MTLGKRNTSFGFHHRQTSSLVITFSPVLTLIAEDSEGKKVRLRVAVCLGCLSSVPP